MKAKHVVVIPIEEARALRDVALTGGELEIGRRTNTARRAMRRIERAMAVAEKAGWRPTR